MSSNNDLWESLLNGTFQAKVKQEKKAKKKLRAKRELAKKQRRKLTSSDYLELGLCPPVVESPWRAEAQIAVFQSTTCACGQHYLSPNPGPRFLRFVHRRTGAIQELPREQALINPALPREIRTVELHCEVCPACFTPSTSAQAELPLFTPQETSND